MASIFLGTRRVSHKGHSAEIQREDTGIMNTRHPARISLSRRDVLLAAQPR
jgi:hypothetical protein